MLINLLLTVRKYLKFEMFLSNYLYSPAMSSEKVELTNIKHPISLVYTMKIVLVQHRPETVSNLSLNYATDSEWG